MQIKNKLWLPIIQQSFPRNCEQQMEWENSASKVHYIKCHIEEWANVHNKCRQYVKLSKFSIGYTRLTHRLFMLKNDQ